MKAVEEIGKNLRAQGNPEKAKLVARYFKTGKGEYGEGDVFIGLNVPQQRKIAWKYANLPSLVGEKESEDRVRSEAKKCLNIGDS